MGADQGSVIAINELSKRYGRADRLALDSLSLDVRAGEVYGFLGPNGAGKSTTIRLLMHFLQPTGGRATILGQDIVKDSVAIKRSVGYLAGDLAMYPKMTGRQYLAYMRELQPGATNTHLRELSQRLKADLGKPLGVLSRGNRQKIGIIQAFMHLPKVLILDEPSSGLDPLMQEVFYELIGEAKQRGSAIFMSSHTLSEVQKICDRVGIIREGKLVGERNIAEMAQEAAQYFDVTFMDQPPLSELKALKGVRITYHHDQTVTLHVQGKLGPLFAVLAKYDTTKVATRDLDLEEVFLHFYKGDGS